MLFSGRQSVGKMLPVLELGDLCVQGSWNLIIRQTCSSQCCWNFLEWQLAQVAPQAKYILWRYTTERRKLESEQDAFHLAIFSNSDRNDFNMLFYQNRQLHFVCPVFEKCASTTSDALMFLAFWKKVMDWTNIFLAWLQQICFVKSSNILSLFILIAQLKWIVKDIVLEQRGYGSTVNQLKMYYVVSVHICLTLTFWTWFRCCCIFS